MRESLGELHLLPLLFFTPLPSALVFPCSVSRGANRTQAQLVDVGLITAGSADVGSQLASRSCAPPPQDSSDLVVDGEEIGPGWHDGAWEPPPEAESVDFVRGQQ